MYVTLHLCDQGSIPAIYIVLKLNVITLKTSQILTVNSQKMPENLLGTTNGQERVGEYKDLVQPHRHTITDPMLSVHEHYQTSLSESIHH